SPIPKTPSLLAPGHDFFMRTLIIACVFRAHSRRLACRICQRRDENSLRGNAGLPNGAEMLARQTRRASIVRGDQRLILISTRRLRERPEAVLLSATGRASPSPSTDTNALRGIPELTR